jgi:hypothetical protein
MLQKRRSQTANLVFPSSNSTTSISQLLTPDFQLLTSAVSSYWHVLFTEAPVLRSHNAKPGGFRSPDHLVALLRPHDVPWAGVCIEQQTAAEDENRETNPKSPAESALSAKLKV